MGFHTLVVIGLYFFITVAKPEVSDRLTLMTWIFAILFLISDVIDKAASQSSRTAENKHEEEMERLSVGEIEDDAKEVDS